MSDRHGLAAINLHGGRELLLVVAAVCAVALTPSLAELARGPVLPASLFCAAGVLVAAWLRVCLEAARPSTSLAGLGMAHEVGHARLAPAIIAWAATPLVLALVRTAGWTPPRLLELALLAITGGAMLLVALAMLGINRYVWSARRADVARGRQMLSALAGQGAPEKELERLTRWLDWKEGLGSHGPDLLVREGWFPGIRLTPWHDVTEFEDVRALEQHAPEVIAELRALAGEQQLFRDEAPTNPEMKSWRSVAFYKRYQPVAEVRARCPRTAELVDRITGGVCRDALVSVLGPGGRIAPHQDPDNLFLTCHLGIRIPDGCGLHLGGETRTWKEGHCFVFNAAFSHHVWNDSTSPRIILLVDILHPDLTPLEKRFLTDFFTRRDDGPARSNTSWKTSADASRASPPSSSPS